MIHGTKKQKTVKTEQQIKEDQELSNKINARLADFFVIRNKQYSDQDVPKYMQFTALLMQLCSDIPTIFNFRRQLLQRQIKINGQDLQQTAKLLVNEIKLITKLIREDPKSYTLWSFRQWLVQNIYKFNKTIVSEEKQLCKLLLMKDEKNFHVWNYRNWINSIQLNVDEELLFTEQKIKSNPFNFSPYHFRSKYLPLKYLPVLKDESSTKEIKEEIARYGMPKSVFDAQLQSIQTATYLNPNEQAPWIYYRWLIKRLLPVLILDIKSQNNKHTIVLNQKVKNFGSIIKFDKEFTTLTKDNMSNVWQFTCEGNIVLPSSEEIFLIDTDGIQKHLVFDITESLNQIREIFVSVSDFIKQILEEEPDCRFAWLQFLEITKNQLFLTCNQEKWKSLVSEGQKAFQKLDKELKTAHYISKLRQFWFRIGKQQNITQQQRLLIR